MLTQRCLKLLWPPYLREYHTNNNAHAALDQQFSNLLIITPPQVLMLSFQNTENPKPTSRTKQMPPCCGNTKTTSISKAQAKQYSEVLHTCWLQLQSPLGYTQIQRHHASTLTQLMHDLDSTHARGFSGFEVGWRQPEQARTGWIIVAPFELK